MEKALLNDLISSIRAGDLAATKAALDAGADCNQPDDHGVAGLPLRIACFNGHLDIVRELARRGADVNPNRVDALADNLIVVAVHGEQTETVRLLIELGTDIPPGVQTGLSLMQILAAQGIANRAGRDAASAPASLPVAPPVLASRPADIPAPAAKPEIPQWIAEAGGQIEHIDLQGCFGVDTNALNDDVMRMANNATAPEPEPEHLDLPPIDTGKFRFWKKKA